MALLPSYNRINTKDYPSQYQDLVDQLSQSVNDSFQSLFDALNKKLTITDNFLGTIGSVTVTVDSTGKPVNQTILTTGLSASPKGLVVIQATNNTNSAVPPTSAPFITFSTTSSGSGVNVVNVAGLPASNSFTLQVLVLG